MAERVDGTQLASIRIADGKARTAVEFRRPTKALEDVIARGGAGLRYFTVPGVNLMEGGVPIVLDGEIVGGIGVSRVDSKDDAQIAQAGADAVDDGLLRIASQFYEYTPFCNGPCDVKSPQVIVTPPSSIA
jgi:glc operon protein GlcG